MTQQIGITMGTPIMSAVATTQIATHTTHTTVLDGVGLAVLVNTALFLHTRKTHTT